MELDQDAVARLVDAGGGKAADEFRLHLRQPGQPEMQARPSAGEKVRREHRAERHLDHRLLELVEAVVQTVHEPRLDAADGDDIGAQRGDMAFTVVVELYERRIALGMGVDLVLHQAADLHQRVVLALVDGVFEEDPVKMRGKEDDTGCQRQREQQPAEKLAGHVARQRIFPRKKSAADAQAVVV